ncbi:MAG: hypothetical protein G01um10147_867 [Microgenomates group bacterium Gr01-1014_7]|nr:MAG: hypothetical protein G01um10147_867 [Microgenomates group bacterium Gr01-1014_7]
MQVEGLMLHYEWDRDEVAYTGTRLVGFCRRYIGYVGTEGFTVYLSQKFLPTIKTHRVGSAWFVGQGLSLEFRWPPPNNEAIKQNNEGLNLEPEPIFVFHDRSYGVLPPSLRSVMFDTIDDITGEFVEVYKLVSDRNSDGLVQLRYPKERYATPLGTAALLGP